MSADEAEFRGELAFAFYVIVGVPIAHGFMRRQNMTSSSRESGQHEFVVIFLAGLWPILLFATFVNWLQRNDED